MEIHTPVLKNGEFGKQEIYFFADNDEREFHSEEELIQALTEVSSDC
jgi:hypothetical protein